MSKGDAGDGVAAADRDQITGEGRKVRRNVIEQYLTMIMDNSFFYSRWYIILCNLTF